MAIKIYKLTKAFGASRTDEHIVVSESGTWEHGLLEHMQNDHNIEWFNTDEKSVNVDKRGHRIFLSKCPRWIKYFVGKYWWMFNDPLSWRTFGLSNPSKLISVGYKWKWLNNESR